MPDQRMLQLIGDLRPAGAENVVVNLAKGLKFFKFDVLVLSREGGSLLQKLNGISTQVLSKKGLFDWQYLLALSKFVHNNKIDIIHSHLFGNNFYGFLAALLTKRKVILTIHGEDCFKSKKRKLFYKSVAPFVSKIVTVSKPLYQRLVSGLGIKKEKVSLIPNGIDTTLFQCTIDLINQKRKLGISIDAPIIGAVGNIKPVKGYDILLNAAADILKVIPNACFLIVGGVDPHYKECMRDLKARTVGKNLINNVYFLGERDDVERILPILDIYVLPSRSEGTSIALLEAMASGRPIIATNVGGTPDIIEDNKTGILIPPEDPSSLSEAIIKLLKNNSIAKKMGENTRIAVQKDHSVDSMVNNYINLYNEIITFSDNQVSEEKA